MGKNHQACATCENDPRLGELDRNPDRARGISQTSMRCLFDGQRAVLVCEKDVSAKTQVAALMDLLDLHLHGDGTYAGQSVHRNRVALLLCQPKPEAVGAIRTLSKLVRDRAEISVLSRVNGDWIPVDEDCSSAAKLVEGRRWLELLNAVPDAPPSWIVDLVEKVGHPGLRIYPMLSPKPRSWSVRLEGLEVAKLTSAGGVLGVGKDSEKVAGKGSPQRRLWVEATGLPDGLRITVETDPAQTVDAIRAFAERWLPVSPVGKVEQNEHVLESRILRGAAPVQVGDTRLALIRESSRVNWGSQFPTLWGSHGKPRYLDALMRDGHVPWALEMKVQGGGGVSQYYRHGVAQTVLYREFIRAATPLHDWFTNRNAGLDPTCCQGAFVVPEVPVGQQKQLEWLRHAQVLCDLFDVRLATVPAVYAERRALSGDISA